MKFSLSHRNQVSLCISEAYSNTNANYSIHNYFRMFLAKTRNIVNAMNGHLKIYSLVGNIK